MCTLAKPAMKNASVHDVKTVKHTLNTQHGTNNQTATVSSFNDDIQSDSEHQDKERLSKTFCLKKLQTDTPVSPQNTIERFTKYYWKP